MGDAPVTSQDREENLGQAHMTSQELPDWRDTSIGGTRIRLALWLAHEVGQGGVFRKADLRAAFPGVEQADRRMRDLRDDSWIIATAREDAELKPDELRLVKIGVPVWEPSARRPKSPTVSSRDRQRALRDDNYTCISCGLSAGERYPDETSRTAKLVVGMVGERLRVRCQKCASGEGGVADAESVLSAARALGDADFAVLQRWMSDDKRGQVDVVWTSYRRLPVDVQAEIRHRLDRGD